VESLLVGLAGVVVLGVGAQWVSWRLKLPAIPFLLLVGFLAGSITGFIDPDAMFGDLLFPLVSLSVAIILFEGGLTLDVAELRVIGSVVRNLATIGVLFTWAAVGWLAHVVLDLDVGMAVLLGAILVVTGPTVIVPMLRHVRPSARVGSAVKWEGIVNDPIGVILAVLVFEVIVSGGVERGVAGAAVGILKAAVAGGVLGLLGAGLVVLLLKRYWVPDFLQSAVTLGVVLAVHSSSNVVQTESGLLAVTVMGSALASQKTVTVHRIVEFKENLRVLLISALFIILAARLPLTNPAYTNPANLLFLAALILVVRPVAVALSTWRSILTWRERAFLAVLAPRGVIAAAVASLFALELAEAGYPAGEALAPITFVVIVGTVGVYGFAAAPVARWLQVASPNPQGQILVGASPWVRDVARALQDQNIKVLLVDANWANYAAARNMGLDAHYGNVLSEHVMDELELEGIGGMLSMTSNDEVNSLAVLHLRELFGRARVFQLSPEPAERGLRPRQIAPRLRGRFLFHRDASHSVIAARYDRGAVVKQTSLTEEFDYDDFRFHYKGAALPLFAVKESGELVIFDAEHAPSPKPGQTLVSLVGPDIVGVNDAGSDHEPGPAATGP
jgi:NhaP-type Na+/H+ or K+/H+ antiporter